MFFAKQNTTVTPWVLLVLSLILGGLSALLPGYMLVSTIVAALFYICAFSDTPSSLLVFPPLVSMLAALLIGGGPYLSGPLLIWGTALALGIAHRKGSGLTAATGIGAYLFSIIYFVIFALTVREAIGTVNAQAIELYINALIGEAMESNFGAVALAEAQALTPQQLRTLENALKSMIPMYPGLIASAGFALSLFFVTASRGMMRRLGLSEKAFESLRAFQIGRVSAVFFVGAMVLGYAGATGMYQYILLNFMMILMLPFVLQGFLTLDAALRNRLSVLIRVIIYVVIVLSAAIPFFNLLTLVMGLGIVDAFSGLRQRFK